jgi:hypothetical protein
MINWLILLAGAAAAAVVGYRWRLERRHRRSRGQLRHITGAEQWWGKR